MKQNHNAKQRVAIIAPTSVVARNYIAHVGNKYDILTVGRRDSNIIFDLARDENLILPKGIDVVINFAGVLHADSDDEIQNMVATNVLAMIKICEAARKVGVRHIILISTINAVLSETSYYYGYYALTKRQGEELACLYCKKMGIKLCIIRPSQIFGPDPGYGKIQALFYTMIKNALRHQPIFIYGSHDAERNYIFSGNLFCVIDEAIDRESEDFIEVISPENVTLSEVARTIVKMIGSSSEISFQKDKQDIKDNAFFAEINIFEKWSLPYIPFGESLRQTIDSMRQKIYGNGEGVDKFYVL